MEKNKIIVIAGLSASGKDTVAKLVEEHFEYEFVVSTSTRNMREGESNGNPYWFVDNDHFEKLIANKELIEYRDYHTTVDGEFKKWYYGVENHSIEDDKSYVIVLDIIGLKGFKEAFGDRIISFFLMTDDETRKRRCLQRGDFNSEEWERRLADDKAKFTPEVVDMEVDYLLESYEPIETLKQLMHKVALYG